MRGSQPPRGRNGNGRSAPAAGTDGKGKRGRAGKAAPAGATKPKRKPGRPERLAQLVVGSPQYRRHQLARASLPPEFFAFFDNASGVRTSEATFPPVSGDRQTGDREIGEIALALPTPDWLHHTLTVTGSADRLAGFCGAARGPGVLPFRCEDRLQEDWLHLLLAPPPELRGISVEGARILSGQLRERVEIRAQAALQDRQAAVCPLDLHALVPMPDALLRSGPDDPRVIAWLWTHWGTTWPLRQVTEEGLSIPEIQALPSGQNGFRYQFWSADWTPWRALTAIKVGWPDITIRIAIDYGGVSWMAAAPR